MAFVQLIVMAMLAVPVCCYELAADHEKTVVRLFSEAGPADQDPSSCCPTESKANSGNCLTCGDGAKYAPLSSVISANYHPSLVHPLSPDQFTKLQDVYIPIFVPPQNPA